MSFNIFSSTCARLFHLFSRRWRLSPRHIYVMCDVLTCVRGVTKSERLSRIEKKNSESSREAYCTKTKKEILVIFFSDFHHRRESHFFCADFTNDVSCHHHIAIIIRPLRFSSHFTRLRPDEKWQCHTEIKKEKPVCFLQLNFQFESRRCFFEFMLRFCSRVV